MEEQEVVQEQAEAPEEGLDGGAKVILALGCLGSLIVASLLAWVGVVAGIWILHKLAEG